MKKDDRQLLDWLRQEFEKSAETANVPLRLQKDSMVAMLKNEERKEKDFSDKTGTKSKNIIILRRLTAAAAMLAIAVIGILAMRMEGIRVIRKDSFYESYESGSPIKNAKSYREVEVAISEILAGKAPQAAVPSTESQTGEASTAATTRKAESPLEGYSSYVAASNSLSGVSGVYDSGYSFNKTDGISSFGDFEADIVKNDGEFLYIVTTGTSRSGGTIEQIQIVRAVPADKMQVVSTITLAEYSSSETVDECFEIYLKDGKLIALINRNNSSTVAAYYDISNPERPAKIREHIQDGKYVSSGLHENMLCLVTDKSIASSDVSLIPSFSVDGSKVSLGAEDIFIAVNDPDASYIFITVTDISNLTSPVGHLAILGSGKQLYCSSRAVTVARNFVSVDTEESLTEIYRFNLKGSSIVFGGSYVTEGSLIGGLSIDESSGYLRAATSAGDTVNIYILDEGMQFVSGLKKSFPDKKITGIRFIGNSVYVVLGEETMIIDLSDPSALKPAATIASVQFTGDLYAISDTTLLGILCENESVTFSLFDISAPANPKEAAKYTLDSSYRMISAGDSRSVLIISDKNMFGIPVTSHNSEAQADVSAYILFSVSGGRIAPAGIYNHDEAFIGDAAVRSECIGNVIYTVSGEKVSAFSIDSGSVIASAEIR